MAKRSIAPIANGPLTLRLIEASDLAMTREWRNQDQIRKWFLNSNVITPEQHEAWFEQYRDRDDDFVFVIEEQGTVNRPIGQVSIYAIEWERQRAKFGRLMIGDPAARGRGLAQRVVEMIVHYAAATLGIRVLRLEVREGNDPAIAIYQRCGFTVTERVDGELRMVRRSGPQVTE